MQRRRVWRMERGSACNEDRGPAKQVNKEQWQAQLFCNQEHKGGERGTWDNGQSSPQVRSRLGCGYGRKVLEV